MNRQAVHAKHVFQRAKAKHETLTVRCLCAFTLLFGANACFDMFLQFWDEVEKIGLETLEDEAAEKKRREIAASVAKGCSVGAQMTLIMGGGAFLLRWDYCNGYLLFAGAIRTIVDARSQNRRTIHILAWCFVVPTSTVNHLKENEACTRVAYNDV